MEPMGKPLKPHDLILPSDPLFSNSPKSSQLQKPGFRAISFRWRQAHIPKHPQTSPNPKPQRRTCGDPKLCAEGVGDWITKENGGSFGVEGRRSLNPKP